MYISDFVLSYVLGVCSDVDLDLLCRFFRMAIEASMRAMAAIEPITVPAMVPAVRCDFVGIVGGELVGVVGLISVVGLVGVVVEAEGSFAVEVADGKVVVPT